MKKREEMQAGAITRDGFLGSDKRTLDEIIRADDETVKKLGFTHRTIADRMRFFRDESKRGLGGFVKIGPHFEASCEMARGFLPCPFGEPGQHRKTMVIVRNLRRQKEIAFSDLNLHLIAKHGFYEGRGAPFRLEPQELAEILEIGPLNS